MVRAGTEKKKTQPQISTTMADTQDVKSADQQHNYAVGNNSDPKNVQELTSYVQNLLQQMQDKFQNMSDQIINRLDEMGNRIDELEKNIAELMTHAGVEGPDQ